MRLLVVEDEENLRTVIRKRLTKEGYSVDACGDGQEALDYMAVSPYDTVILDIMIERRIQCGCLRRRTGSAGLHGCFSL